MKTVLSWPRGPRTFLVAGAIVVFAVVGAATAPANAQATAIHPSNAHVSARAHKRAAHKSKQPLHASAVKISNFKFSPATITVKAGRTVVWTNKDAIGHSVNFNTVKVNSKTLSQGARFSHTFSTPGTYHYICAIHPFMHGTVIVTS